MMPQDNKMQNETSLYFREMAKAVLSAGAHIAFRAGGASMSPFIRDNETVIIEPLTRTLRTGDIILFEAESRQLLLHRIVKKKRDGYVTRGDATCHEDCPVPHSAVLGRAVHVVGGLNFHFRVPLSTLLALALRLRERPMFFKLLKVPGSLLLRSLRQAYSRQGVSAHTN